MRRASLLTNQILILGFFLSSFVSGQGIEPWNQNRWYWSHAGNAVLLLGGSDDDNLFQWPKEKLIKQLDRIQAAGGNVVRNTMSDRQDGGFEVYPFLKLPNGKFDLNQWNPDYWNRFETFLTETHRRRIFVQIEIWDRFDFTDVRSHDPHRWEKKHPFNPANNINYSFAESGFAARYPDHPGKNKQPFFFTTPEQRNNTVVLPFQRAFVNKFLDYTLKFDHVLYCIDNETRAEPSWGKYWATFIRERARSESKTVMITEMWDAWDLRDKSHQQTFDYPELYDYVDVSQNNHNKGEKHWQNFLYVRDYLDSHPRPINTTKTYGADGNKFKHSDQDAIERFWRHLLAGAASIRFHRPDSGLGINDKAFACIAAARKVEALVPIWDLKPNNKVLASRSENEAYAAVNEDQSRLVVYFPTSSSAPSVRLKIPTTFDFRSIEWIHIDSGRSNGEKKLATDELRPPGNGNFVAVVKFENSKSERR